MEVFECISIIATVIRIWFSLTDTHKPPHSQRHTHTHTETPSLAGSMRRGCSGLPYHFKHPSAQQRYHISSSSAYGADRMTNEREGGRERTRFSPSPSLHLLHSCLPPLHSPLCSLYLLIPPF